MKAQDLKCISLFAEIEDKLLERLAMVVTEQTLKDGELIFSEGDTGDAICCIAKGMVRVDKRIDKEKETMRTLGILGPGECFGEIAFFDQQVRSAFTTAYGETTIYRLSRDSLQNLFRENAVSANRFLLAVIKTFTERFRILNASVVVYHEIGRAIGAANSLQDLLEVVLRQLRLATGSSYGMILLKQEFSNRFDVKCAQCISLSEEHFEKLIQGGGLCRVLTTELRGLLIHDLENDEQAKKIERIGFETPSMIWAPFVVQDELLGIIALGDSAIGRFSLNDLNLCEGVSLQTAQAIREFRRREEENQRQKLSQQYIKF